MVSNNAIQHLDSKLNLDISHFYLQGNPWMWRDSGERGCCSSPDDGDDDDDNDDDDDDDDDDGDHKHNDHDDEVAVAHGEAAHLPIVQKADVPHSPPWWQHHDQSFMSIVQSTNHPHHKHK